MAASPPPGELDPLSALDAAFHCSQRSDFARRPARPRGEVKRVRSQSRCSVHKLLRSFTTQRQQQQDGSVPLQAAGQEQAAAGGGSNSSSRHGSRHGSAPRHHSPHPGRVGGGGGGSGGGSGGVGQLPYHAPTHHHHSHHHHGRRSAKAKQKALQKARAFKDLDMTIELLGIDSSSNEQQQLLSHMSLPLSLTGRLASLGLLTSTAGASPGWATPTASQAHTPGASAASWLQPTAAAGGAATAAAAAGTNTDSGSSSSSAPLHKVQRASALSEQQRRLAAASGAAAAAAASGSSYLAAAKRTVSFKQPAAAAAGAGRPHPQQQQQQPSQHVAAARSGARRFSRSSSSGAATPPSGLGAAAAGGSGGEGGAARPPLHAAPSLAGSDRLSERLAQDRAALQCALHNVLEGGPALEGPDDVAAALADAQGRADELASELAGLLRDVAAAEDWRARELLLGWAEDAYVRAKLITKDLSHLSLVESLGRSSAYNGIIATCTPAITTLVAALASNVSGGIAPHLQQQPLPPPPPQQQQEQQPLLQQQALLWRCQQAIESSTAAAVRTAAVGSPGSGSPAAGAAPAAAPAAPFPGGEDEVRVVFKLLRRLLELIKEIAARCRTNSQQVPALAGVCSAATSALQDAACRLVTATLAAAAYEQAGLMLPANLGAGVGHKVSSRARLVTLLWRYTHDLGLKVGKAFDGLHPLCLLLLMQLLTAAATAAINMQKLDMRAAVNAAAAASGGGDADAAGGSDSDGSSSCTKSEGSSAELRPRHRRSCSSSSYGVVSAGPRSALGDISASDSDDAWSLETTLDRDSFTSRGADAEVWAALGQRPSREAADAPPAGGGHGVRRAAGRRRSLLLPPVTDASIQQQAWLPQLLHVLCHGSNAVAKQVVEALTASESFVDAGLPPLLSVESEEALSDSLEDLQEAWYWLALTNTRRCARLTAAPDHALCEGLSLWALEILRTTAAGALKLVQDYDNSALGLGQALEGIDEDQGLRLFKSLKRATDAVINGLLRVQQLLKVRRIEADAAPPAPPQQQQPQLQQSRQQQPQQSQQQPQLSQQQQQQPQQQQRNTQQPRRVAERWDLVQQPRQRRPPSGQHAGAASGQGQPQPGGTNGFAAAAAGSSRWPQRPPAAPGGAASRCGAAAAGSRTVAVAPRSTSSTTSRPPAPPRWNPAQGLGFSPPDSRTAADSHHAAAGTEGHSFSGWMAARTEQAGTRNLPSPDESPRASPPTAILGTTPTAGNIWLQRVHAQQPPLRGSTSAAPAPTLAAGSAATVTTSPARVSPFGAAAAEASPFSPTPGRQLQPHQQQRTASGGAGSAQSAPRSFRDVLAATAWPASPVRTHLPCRASCSSSGSRETLGNLGSAGGAAAARPAEQQQQCEAGSSFQLLSGGTRGPLAQDLAVAACVLGGPHAQQVQQQQQLSQDASAAADALAAAEREGSSLAHAVLPAALAILRMIQATEDMFWKVRWSDLEGGLLRKLGSGSYGQVYQGVYLNAHVAIKVLNHSIDSTDGLSAETLLRFKAEVDFQRKLSHHPNVVRFIGACCELPAGLTDALAEAASSAAAASSASLLGASGALSSVASASASSSTSSAWPSRTASLAAGGSCVPVHLARGVKLAIVMELCQLGSLFSMIGQARRVRAALADGHQSPAELRRQLPYGWQFHCDWLTRLDVLRGAAAGLEFMHKNGVIHRDLTSYNLLLAWGRPWQAKVCDFNLSRMATSAAVNNSGNPNSPAWQSPEILGGECYSTATDVFSFAVVMWEVLTLLEPWREETEGRPQLYFIMSSVCAGGRLGMPEAHELQQQGQPGLSASLASTLLALMQRCWAQQPAARPGMGEVAGQLSQLVQRLRDERRAAAAAARTKGAAA